MNNPHAILGVQPNASPDAIKRAYRQLAKKYHPDKNPSQHAQNQFKQIQLAYQKLTQKPHQHNQNQQQQQRNHNNQRNAHHNASFFNLHDIFRRYQKQNQKNKTNGANINWNIAIPLELAAQGGKKTILAYDDNQTDSTKIEISIPPGTQQGQKLRLAGKGTKGKNGGKNGDAIVQVHILPHPIFTIEDNTNLATTLPVRIDEAVLGAKIKAPTPAGPIAITIPAHSNSGRILRIKGKGLKNHKTQKNGDLLYTLDVKVPDQPDPELTHFLRTWGARTQNYNPRSLHDPRRRKTKP